MNLKRLHSFTTRSTSGLILCEKGRWFYAWDRSGVRFNLPPGSYTIVGMIGRPQAPRKYCPTPPRPPRHRVRIFRDASREARSSAYALQTATGRKTVLIGDIAATYPRPVIALLYGHELGHLAGLTDESACDHYGARWMLSNGYNPSQVFAAAQILGFDPARQRAIRATLKKKYQR